VVLCAALTLRNLVGDAMLEHKAGEKTVFLSHLYIKNDDFTKTGSGQT
jgi:hypothetical protein